MATTNPGTQSSAPQTPGTRGTTELEPRRNDDRRGELTRREDSWPSLFGLSPFGLMRSMIEDMFGETGLGRSYGTRDIGRWEGTSLWTPRIDVVERNGQLLIRADLPGLTKNDVRVETRDDMIIIEGERKAEQEDSKSGYYRVERTYGSFRRVIPLPEGTNTDQATASFRNGVLEIALKAPERSTSKSKRLEIQETPVGAPETPTRH